MAAVFPPPKPVLLSGLKITLVLMVPLTAVSIVVGGQAVMPAVMGFLAAAIVPFCTLRQAAIMIPGLALTGVLATLASQTGWAVLVVVAACIAAGLASRVSAGVFGVAPIVAAVMGLDPPKNSALVVGLVMLAVSAYVVLIVHVMKFHITPAPIPFPVAVRHGLVMAAACGSATAIALQFDWPRSYWLVMTLAIVLRPYVTDSLIRNRQRIVGTVAGSVIAVVLSPLPHVWQLLFAAVCLTLMLSYIVLKNYVLQVTFMTPMMVFLVSTGTVTNTLQMDGLRVLYTAVACIVGGMLALLLAWQDEAA